MKIKAGSSSPSALRRRGFYFILGVGALCLLSFIISPANELDSKFDYENVKVRIPEMSADTKENTPEVLDELDTKLAALGSQIDLINDQHESETELTLTFLRKLSHEMEVMKVFVKEIAQKTSGNEPMKREEYEEPIRMEDFFREKFALEGTKVEEPDKGFCWSPRARLWRKYGDYRAYKKDGRVGEHVNVSRIEEKLRVGGRHLPKITVPDFPFGLKPPAAAKTDCKKYHEPIDVVFTWVNGTDPNFLKQLEENEPAKASETEASRFKDMNQLKYAIRSFQKYAPWVRDIILVTNGQVPVWLNTDHPNVRVVTHSEIFPNQDHLPTFSSPAIEINIHRIPGLSNRFIYSNDDFFLMQPICPDIFITKDDELILYPKEGTEHGTAYGWKQKYRWKCDCPEDEYANGVCNNHKQCNKFECFWDGHDCDDVKPTDPYYIDTRASYHQSVDYTQLVLDRKFHGPGKGVMTRTWNSHMPMMLDKRIIQKIWEDFPLEAEVTSSHTRRKKTDLQFQIMNIYYAKESPRNHDYESYPYFKHVIKPQDKIVGYYAMKKDWKKSADRLVKARQHQKIFNCLNDDLKHDGSENTISVYFLIEQFYEEYFPEISPMEKFNYYPHDLYADLL